MIHLLRLRLFFKWKNFEILTQNNLQQLIVSLNHGLLIGDITVLESFFNVAPLKEDMFLTTIYHYYNMSPR